MIYLRGEHDYSSDDRIRGLRPAFWFSLSAAEAMKDVIPDE